ncbi:proton-dependent oligopeptide transporter, POT family [Catalinimonas alkaloidigena]|uniref:Proton-dependent oligopeptide transporter, POT family n=1 Tax=Catalinimonas alkaloidigena TaxID=1075417 RepID=A0A1G8XTG9_9BACT|nr:peptide MFS transporter [Catalinimonas alkaloidigena]SDJ93818.1 proton-dependent oligopeptide transporter, POT family [Catalinimonas alkaloidigena]
MDFTLTLLIFGWIFVAAWVPIVIATNRKTHPMALFVLFGAEMWERFSFYGMRALLTLYMSKVLFQAMEGAESRALGVYGSYTAMVYLFPVLGGLVADRIFGFRKAILWGGILMMLGHFTLALEGTLFEGSLFLFFFSLALIIVGNGYFKPNISSFLGDFYEKDDPRKDGAFTIFYMGVNIGSFLATLTCGYVGERINWHYGFGLAGIGMACGLLLFWICSRTQVLGDKGLVPPSVKERGPVVAGLRAPALVYIGSLMALPIVALMLNISNIVSGLLVVTTIGIIGYLVYEAVQLRRKARVMIASGGRPGAYLPEGEGTDEDTASPKAEGDRLLVVTVLFFFHAIFWALFEQAGGSLTLFTDKNVQRMLGGTEVPASIFQSLNPLFIMLLAPVFSWIWLRLRKRNAEPSTPMKFVLGLAQLGLGFVIIVSGAKLFATNAQVPMIFVVLMYLFHTMGELSLSPVGLSMITKLSPAKIVGFVMGAWFLSISLGNKIAGVIGQLTAAENLPDEASAYDTLALYSQTYLVWGVLVVLGAALVLLVLVPRLRKWMHGIH